MCVQVLLILQTMRYQHEVVQACKLLAKSVTDPMNLHTLVQAVPAPNDRIEVQRKKRKKNQRGGKGGREREGKREGEVQTEPVDPGAD